MKKQITNATQLVHAVEQHGAFTIYGPQGLIIARQAIAQVMKQAGYGITFDDASSPDLVDYTTVSGLEGAIAGAGLGALVGLLFKQPAAGAAIGAGLERRSA
jgi:hypothetical protein